MQLYAPMGDTFLQFSTEYIHTYNTAQDVEHPLPQWMVAQNGNKFILAHVNYLRVFWQFVTLLPLHLYETSGWPKSTHNNATVLDTWVRIMTHQ